jgi:hypothetical protein
MPDSDPFEGYGSWIALGWSVGAMQDAVERVNTVSSSEPHRAFAAIGEAVWWITIVDSTLRSRHRPAYDLAMFPSSFPPIAETIAGLRSVRNRIGHEVDLVDFIEPVASRPDLGDGRITAWRWKATRQPTRRDARDLKGHRSYEDALAGRNIIDGLHGAAFVLSAAHANAQNGNPARGHTS